MEALIRINGGNYIVVSTSPFDAVLALTAFPVPVAIWKFAVGDYIEFTVYVDTAGARTIPYVADYTPFFWASMISS